jgi:hypothetical protein
MTPAGVLVGGGGGLARIAGRFVASRAGLHCRVNELAVAGCPGQLGCCAPVHWAVGKKLFSFPFCGKDFFCGKDNNKDYNLIISISIRVQYFSLITNQSYEIEDLPNGFMLFTCSYELLLVLMRDEIGISLIDKITTTRY